MLIFWQKQCLKFIVSVLLLSQAFYLHAQRENIRFRHLTIEDGLSQSSVFCILQDSKGFMWFGTETGLNKYDGYSFTVYKYEVDNPNSISNHNIITIYKDRNNIFWIGTEKGLNRFDPGIELFTRFVHNPDDTTGLCDHRVLSICEDPSGYLWLGTENGLEKFDPENKQFIHYRADPGNPKGLSHNLITSIYLDPSGFLWIGTGGGGLNRFDREKEQFICYKNIPGDSTSLSDNNVFCIHEDNTGALWIGTEEGGLNRFDREKEQFTCYKNIPGDPASLSDNHVNVIYEDRSGALWIGTNNGGLNIFDREKNAFVRYMKDPNDPHSLSINRVKSLYEDNTGGLWFGTRGGGINIYSRETQKFVHYKRNFSNPNSLSDDMIWAIYEDHNEILWIGTDFGGLNKIDRKKNKFTHYDHDPDDPYSISENSIYTIYEDKSGLFWIGTRSQGLNKFDPKTGRFSHYKHDPGNPYSISNNKVFCVYEDHLSVLWVGVINNDGGGLNKFDRESERFTLYKHDPDDPYSISNNKVFCILEDPSNNLWMGTNGGGLNRFDRKTERFFNYKSDSSDNKSLTGDFILSLYEDRTGILWVGANNGLNKFEKDKETFTRYTTEEGLPDDVIYDILEDDKGNLWMSTNNGLAKFNPETEEFKNYDVNDGLQSNEFNTGTAFKNKKGEMFFGGIGGFNSFYPDNIRDNPHIPSIVITDFQISNKSVPIGKMGDGRTILEKSIAGTDEIELSYKDNVFSFEFAALHYATPDKNQYAYFMEGLEKDWNYVGNRRYVTYSGLPPGMYHFKVKGSNNDGVWNEEGTSLKIKIIPPFWRTWWFYILCVIFVVLIVAALFIYQINKIKKKKEEEARRRVTGIFSQVLEQGDAVVYHRRIDSEEYDYMGEGIKDITGYDLSEFTCSFWKDIVIGIEIVGDLAGLPLKEAHERIRKGEFGRYVADLKIRTKSGEMRWVRDMTTALRDESGVCNACFGIFFDITDRKLAEKKLAQLSEELSIKNKEMEKDLDMARDVQMALLSQNYPKYFPKNVPEEQSSLQFSHRYIPASTLAGDFFEIFPISDHQVGIMIYDVMGHGVRASLLTAYLHGLVEELMPSAADPVIFIKRLNVGLSALGHFLAGMFSTAFYLVADIKKGTMRYTNAGHPTPYILRRRIESVEKLKCDGKRPEPALGLFKECDYTAHESEMSDDDIVLFFTDGVYEVVNASGQLFGKERLITSVKNQIHQPPEKMLDGILDEIKRYTGTSEFADDVCMVTMHVGKGSFNSL